MPCISDNSIPEDFPSALRGGEFEREVVQHVCVHSGPIFQPACTPAFVCCLYLPLHLHQPLLCLAYKISIEDRRNRVMRADFLPLKLVSESQAI